MRVTTLNGSQHADAPRNDALDGLSSLGMLYESRVFDALLEFIAPGLLAFAGGDGLINVCGHGEVMSKSLAVTRNFSRIRATQAEFTCKPTNVASQVFCAICLLSWP